MVDIYKIVEDLQKVHGVSEPEFGLHVAQIVKEAFEAEISFERDALRAELYEKDTELKKWKYVPGVMHCAKCNFQSIKSVLNMSSGTVTAGDSNPEPCPNGCGPLWRVSWEKYANDHYEGGLKAFEKLRAAELELEAARKQEPFCWYMWNPSEPDGLNEGFVQFCEHNPASQNPDHNGHIWKAIKLYASPVPAQQPEAEDELIEQLWQNSNHGTRREDIEAAFRAGAALVRKSADKSQRGGVYSSDPLACGGCLSGCPRCRF